MSLNKKNNLIEIIFIEKIFPNSGGGSRPGTVRGSLIEWIVKNEWNSIKGKTKYKKRLCYERLFKRRKTIFTKSTRAERGTFILNFTNKSKNMTHSLFWQRWIEEMLAQLLVFWVFDFRFWIMSDPNSDLEISWADEAESPSNRRTWSSLFRDLESHDELINGLGLP